MNLNDKAIEKLKEWASRKTWAEKVEDSSFETTYDDFAGGNIDDAYDGGVDDGQTYLAREILAELGIFYVGGE